MVLSKVGPMARMGGRLSNPRGSWTSFDACPRDRRMTCNCWVGAESGAEFGAKSGAEPTESTDPGLEFGADDSRLDEGDSWSGKFALDWGDDDAGASDKT